MSCISISDVALCVLIPLSLVCCVFHGYYVNSFLPIYAFPNTIVLHPVKLALVSFQFVHPPLFLLCNTDWNQNFFDVFLLDVRESHSLKQKKNDEVK